MLITSVGSSPQRLYILRIIGFFVTVLLWHQYLVRRGNAAISQKGALQPQISFAEHVQYWKANGTKSEASSPLEVGLEQKATQILRGNLTGGSGSLSCQPSIGLRYKELSVKGYWKKHYYFALNLHQSADVLPSLLGAIIKVIRFLGPKRCVLSVVEGRSTDGTYQILEYLQRGLKQEGLTMFLIRSELDPKDGTQDRMEALAFLRNLALAPLVEHAGNYDSEAQVVFLNDVNLCPHDILELMYQHKKQGASMTCGMDWSENGSIFYDIYAARSIVGETFWQIAQDGLWHFSDSLFWADLDTKAKFEKNDPFQVYACWNGGTVISARPIMRQLVQFRRNHEGECYMSEATLFAKDLWKLDQGRIQVVPSVNVAYDDTIGRVKELRGRVEDRFNTSLADLQTETMNWQAHPPSLVKCMEQFHQPHWVAAT